jgi:hypothetical protein
MTTLLLTTRIGVRNVVEEGPFLMTRVGLDLLKFDVEERDPLYPLDHKVKELLILLEREKSECGDGCLILQLRYATI